MRGWLVTHWKALAGVFLSIPGAWSGFKWLLDWGGRIDVFRTWGAAVIDNLPAVPPWANLVLLLAGIILIRLDLKRRPAPATGHMESPRPVTRLAKPDPSQKKPKRHYATSEIEQMIGALRRMRDVIHEKSMPLYSEAYALWQNWQPAMWNDSQLPDPEKIKQVMEALKILSARTQETAPQLQKIVFENDSYQDVLRPVYRDAKGSPSGMVGPLDRLAVDLHEILGLISGTQPQTNGMFRFLATNYLDWQKEIQELGQWNGSVLARITDTTKELREWRND